MRTWNQDGHQSHGGGGEGRGAPGKRTLTSALQRRESPAPAPAGGGPVAARSSPHEDPFWFVDVPVQRKVTFDPGEDDHDLILDNAVESVLLMAPEDVKSAFELIKKSKDIELIMRFADVGKGNYGHTAIKGQTIWIEFSTNLLPEEEGDEFQNSNAETELQATLIHEFVLHVLPALPTIIENKKEWDGDEDDEHGALDGWLKVFETAATVNSTVLRNTIIDALKHLHEMGKNAVELCQSIEKYAGKHKVNLYWRVSKGDVYEVVVGNEDAGDIRLVSKDGQLVEVDMNEDPVKGSHDFIPFDDHMEDSFDTETKQLKLELEPRAPAPAGGATQGSGSGLPADLRGGLEEMSGFDLSGVSVTRNSREPATMNARAFARGNEIHLGPGNEAELPHEAWHVVQQMQGRVAANTQHAGNAVNDDAGLEREADEMGARAARGATGEPPDELMTAPSLDAPAQRRGVTMELLQKAIGGSFRQTAGSQQTSDDLTFNDAIICHYSILESDPSKIHISFYPSDDEKYQKKIQHCAYTWNSELETFTTAGVQRGTWKPYAKFLSQFQSHADELMKVLAKAVKRLLDEDGLLFKRDPGAVAQRMVHDGDDEDEGEELGDKREVFNRIREQLVIDRGFIDKTLTRIQRLIADPGTKYTLDQVIEVLVKHGLATPRASGDAPDELDVSEDPREWVDDEFDHEVIDNGKDIGGKAYTPIGARTFTRDGDQHVWRVKDSEIQRGYAETEFLAGLLYARITGQGGAIELHYGSEDGYGVIVKQHIEGYRNWANGGEDFSHEDYDACGLGAIAVAAWFLGEHDMHTANFGPVGDSEAPPLTVVDGSGALHEDNLDRAVLRQDYDRLPLPPRDWTHSTSGWQMHDRCSEAEPKDQQVLLSNKVKARLPAEKKTAMQRIATLDFGEVQQQILTSAFLEGQTLQHHEDGENVHVCREWLKLRPTLERRQNRIRMILARLD